MTPSLTIIEKQTKQGPRYFAIDPPNGFDGSAQGYGYKSEEGLRRAFKYHMQKDQIQADKNLVQEYLLEHQIDINNFFEWMKQETEKDIAYALKYRVREWRNYETAQDFKNRMRRGTKDYINAYDKFTEDDKLFLLSHLRSLMGK